MTPEPDETVAVHVVPFYPPHPGGMERVAAEIVRALPPLGVRPLVLTSDIGGDGIVPPREPHVRRLRGIEVGHTPIMWGLMPALWRLPRRAVLHVHVAQAFVPDVAAWVARRRGQPVLAHFHLDVDPSGPLGVLLRPYQRVVLRRTLVTADAVVVPTPDYAELVHESYAVPHDRLHVIPNGTILEVTATSKSAPETRPWRLLSVGRLQDQKNHSLLLAACEMLRRQRPDLDWSLDIYGEGELEASLRREIERFGLHERVRLAGGHLSLAQMREVYDHGDLFVLTTRKESFGIVYVEAMARGLPIVTTNVPGVRNVVREGVNGVLTREDPAEVANALATLMSDEGRYAEMSRANLDEARHYDWTAIAHQFAELYAKLLSRSPCGRGTSRTSARG